MEPAERVLGSRRLALRDVVGSRGQGIVYMRLTEYGTFGMPLFDVAFLGDKWPAIDFHVELNGVDGMRPFFLVQAKATTRPLHAGAKALFIRLEARDVSRLLELPGPTYLFGVHEPTGRVFARSVHLGTPVRAITRIRIEHELTPSNLRRLHAEVVEYWSHANLKPSSSEFE